MKQIMNPRACTPLYEPQAADPTAQRLAGVESALGARVWSFFCGPLCQRKTARKRSNKQKGWVVLCLRTKLAPRAAHRPAARTRTPVVSPSRPVMVSWWMVDMAARRARACGTWGGVATKGRLRMAASPAKRKRAADARAPSSRGRTWLLSKVGFLSCCR